MQALPRLLQIDLHRRRQAGDGLVGGVGARVLDGWLDCTVQVVVHLSEEVGCRGDPLRGKI